MHQAIGSLPVGLYIAKDMFRRSAKMLGILRGLGHDVVAWDEESLIYVSEGGAGLVSNCSTVPIWRRGTWPQSVPQNPALAASATIGLVGGARVRNRLMGAFSRSMVPTRSRIMATPTFAPPLTEMMQRSVFLPSPVT